jgi:predicted acylesterase/phospholipase RssA
MLPNGSDPLYPQNVSPLYAAAASGKTNAIREFERRRGHALNVLSLSGGGQNGAFGAGLLIGWRESGRRPVFDIVGGVSTGALLATHALLGTPGDDAQLEEMYTRITKKDIYKERGIFGLISGADSLSDTEPLRMLIAKHITAETLKRVADAYAAPTNATSYGCAPTFAMIHPRTSTYTACRDRSRTGGASSWST